MSQSKQQTARQKLLQLGIQQCSQDSFVEYVEKGGIHAMCPYSLKLG